MPLTPDCQHRSTLGFTENSVTGTSSLQAVSALVGVATAGPTQSRRPGRMSNAQLGLCQFCPLIAPYVKSGYRWYSEPVLMRVAVLKVSSIFDAPRMSFSPKSWLVWSCGNTRYQPRHMSRLLTLYRSALHNRSSAQHPYALWMH